MAISFEDMTPAQKNEEKKRFAILLGNRIRDTRKSKGLSQEELAHKAGYYRTYVGHIETARYSPSVHTVWRLAKAMDVNLGVLLKDL